MGLPAKHNLTLARGKTAVMKFRAKSGDGTAVDLTGLKARCQVRTIDGATGLSTTTTLLLDLQNGAGIAITDASAGDVTLSLSSAQTIALCADNERTSRAYEIELYDDSATPEIVTGFLIGKINITTEVAR